MDNKRFNEIFEDTIQKSRDVLCYKSQEYDRGDRFSAFKYGAELQRTTPERVLLGYLSKHLVSLVDLITDDEVHGMELIDAKVIDILNYVILYRAMCIERNEEVAAREEQAVVKRKPMFKCAKPQINTDFDGDIIDMLKPPTNLYDAETYYAGINEVDTDEKY